jgi:hypothetical protein
MTNDQIKYRVAVAIWLSWIASKYVVNRAAIVKASWHLTIAVIIQPPSRICQAFCFISFGQMNHPEVGITISSALLKQVRSFVDTIANPVLKVKFFVLAACALNQRNVADSLSAGPKKIKNCCHKILLWQMILQRCEIVPFQGRTEAKYNIKIVRAASLFTFHLPHLIHNQRKVPRFGRAIGGPGHCCGGDGRGDKKEHDERNHSPEL